MTWYEALIIGFVQGISEFLPISSSAHLLIAEKVLGISYYDPTLTFEILLHFASLLAVLVYFRSDLLSLMKKTGIYLFKREQAYKNDFRFVMLLLISTAVTFGIGKMLENSLGSGITNFSLIAAALIITGIFLIFIEHGGFKERKAKGDITIRDACWIGVAQAIAVIPGISRAGSTLVGAMMLGLKKEEALRYSFLLSIPIISGLTLLKVTSMETLASTSPLSLAVAFISAFAFALVGIRWLIGMVQRTRLSWFAVYCITLGITVWVLYGNEPTAVTNSFMR
ncbi:undecaprenyl-diphosphate phosphatase [Alteribacter natronophilus]|uniref:undecaprenyl-diphosphate phosphatase n=1 Tax=Alteribacter natronophilus TaxID=2583810 RepID=UPI00110DFB5E|nr:undecaprenyl-diphosphate phosphatase [Alteribacter natronophilus]TMW73811.1 undecaprenyl-diphosphate phosphatase [Alteribacter natronophilus]